MRIHAPNSPFTAPQHSLVRCKILQIINSDDIASSELQSPSLIEKSETALTEETTVNICLTTIAYIFFYLESLPSLYRHSRMNPLFTLFIYSFTFFVTPKHKSRIQANITAGYVKSDSKRAWNYFESILRFPGWKKAKNTQNQRTLIPHLQ